MIFNYRSGLGIVNLKHGRDRIIKSEDPDLVARLGAWRTR